MLARVKYEKARIRVRAAFGTSDVKNRGAGVSGPTFARPCWHKYLSRWRPRGAAVRRAGLQLLLPLSGRPMQRGPGKIEFVQQAVRRRVGRRRRDGPRLPHRGRGGRGRALRELGRRGDGRPIRGPRPEKVSARFLSRRPPGLTKEPRDTYSRDRVFFSYLSKHRIIEEFRDRHVLGQPFASASLYHELARQMRRRRRLERM